MKTTHMGAGLSVIVLAIVFSSSLSVGAISATQPAAAASPAVGSPANDTVVTGVKSSPIWYERHDDTEGGIGDTISVRVTNLKAFIDSTQKPDLRADLLVPYIDGIAIPKVYPFSVTSDDVVGSGRVTTLKYVLNYSNDSKDAWVKLLQNYSAARPVEITLGFEKGPHIRNTLVQNGGNGFRFIGIRVVPIGFGILGIVLAVVLFIYLAKTTEIVRDQTAYLRPDESPPYSLARTQMALWFFLVVAAFLFLWIVTGALDTINVNVLALIGISAGAAFGAAIADNSNPPPDDRGKNIARVNLDRPRSEIKKDLELALKAKEQEVAAKEQDQGRIDLTEDQRRADQQLLVTLNTDLRLLQKQVNYFKTPPWRAFLLDLLTERESISFHRFQMVIWTLVLAVIFCVNVAVKFSMWEISPTLLGLMGIVGGTYVGFKLPQAQTQTQPPAIR